MRKHEFVANLPLSLLAKKNRSWKCRISFLVPAVQSADCFLSYRGRGFGQANTGCLCAMLLIATVSHLSFATARHARQQNYRSINPVVIYRNSAHAELLPLAGFFDHGISSLIADIAFTGRLETAKTVVNCINDGQCTVRQ